MKVLKHSGHIKLDSIFPIDDISKVTVTNFYGTHILTDNQLKGFKTQLKGAHSRGSLAVKPGHISIELELKDATIVNAYGYTGQINFDGGFENGFSLSFDLPDINLNYDNYTTNKKKPPHFYSRLYLSPLAQLAPPIFPPFLKKSRS